MRRLLLLLLLTLPLLAVTADEIFTHGDWKVTYVTTDGTIKVHYLKPDGTYRPIFMGSVPEATYDNDKRVARSVRSTDFAQVSTAITDVEDHTFGSGQRFDITFRQPANGDDVALVSHYWFFDGCDYLLTSLDLIGKQSLRSNCLVPVNTTKTYVFLTADNHNRMLKVPFDNDSFVRYQRYPLSTSMTSYEVSAIYEGESRQGLIVGSVDHDHWKNAVSISAEKNDRLKSVRLQSGISTGETHDVLPHGKLEGDTIRSARFYVAFSNDWREGMADFTEACRLVAPKRETWPYGNPVGWMSWNVLEAKNNYTDDLQTMQFIGEELYPAGFHNGQGAPNIISIDSWSNLNESQERELCKQAASLHAVVGCYGCPFSLWWNDGDLDKTYYSSNLSSYTGRDVVLKANGQPLKYDGAFCLDPTHPAVKASAGAWIKSQYRKGFRYFKLDFTTCGIIQADSYYNPDVHTAVEAYNEGFAYYCKKVDELEEPVFITLSISPLFPYQYANARRIACDTWGSINWTEYSMNAITAGWWTDGLYQYNDPDGLPMVGKGDQLTNSMAENRARITNGAAAGMVLMADNFSTSNVSGQGNPTVSRTRAKTLLTNPDINEVIGLGRSFMPVNGYGEYQDRSEGAESFAMLRTDTCLYVAVINYSTNVLRGTLPFARLGLTSADVTAATELWMHNTVSLADEGLPYAVPVKDARLYRIRLSSADTAVRPASTDQNTPFPIPNSPLYDLAGRATAATNPSTIYIQGGKKVLAK